MTKYDELCGIYRELKSEDLRNYGTAYFRGHPGYGKDVTLPARVLAFWERYFDTKEYPGVKANPFQIWVHGFTSLPDEMKATDETPGCASGLNAAMITAGFKGSGTGQYGTASAAAHSFVSVGKRIEKPTFGAIVLMMHKGGPRAGRYHVTTYCEHVGDFWYCRGNNQKNSICKLAYDFKDEEELVSLRSDFEPL